MLNKDHQIYLPLSIWIFIQEHNKMHVFYKKTIFPGKREHFDLDLK